MPITDTVTTRLGELTDLLHEKYFGEFIENSHRHGRITERLIKPASEAVTSDGVTLQFETAKGDTVRFSRSPLQDFNDPGAFQATKLKVRFSENELVNDFSEISGSGRVSHLDLLEKGDGAIVDMAGRIYRQIREDFADKKALHQHLDQTAMVAQVSGTPKKNDKWTVAAASSSPTTTMRCVVDNGPFPAFKEGRKFDIYNGATLIIGNIEVTDSNPDDNSVGFKLRADSTGAADFSTVADNHTFYLSGEKGKGMYGLGAWYSRPGASDSFIGGINRGDVEWRFLMTTASREGLTATRIAKSHLNDLANKMNFVLEEDLAVVALTDIALHQALRDEYGENAFVQYPSGDSRAERFANFGSMGLNYQHPMFGTVKLLADPLAVPNTLRVMVPEDWKELYYGYKGLQFMPGELAGVWDRLESSTPGKGKSKYYQCQAYSPGCTTVCLRPSRQGQILNVTA